MARGLDPDHVGRFVEAAQVVRFDGADTLVVEEGEDAHELYVVLDGEVRVERADGPGDTAHVFATLGPGQTFGEAALLGTEGTRSATVRTNTKSRLLVVDRRLFEDDEATAWALPLVINLAGESARRLAEANRTTVTALEAKQIESNRRISLGHFLGWVVGVLCVYTLTPSLMYTVTDDPVLASMCTNAAILASAFGMYRFLVKCPYPLSSFGLFMPKNWPTHLLEAVVWSTGLIGMVTAGKWLITPAGVPLFEPRYEDPNTTMGVIWAVAITYLVLSLVQEFIVRGTLQSALELFMDEGRYRALYAILMSNLIFSAYHAHLSAKFALVAFLLGLFWGLLYMRQRSVFGVAVCHAIVGTYGIQPLVIGPLK